MKSEVIRFGKKLVDSGLTYSRFGSISIRQGNEIIITRTGCMLDELAEDDVIKARDKARASSELVVHEMIYEVTSANTIIHAHPFYSTLMSLFNKKIEPADSEGALLGEIPVVSGDPGSKELAKNAANALKNHRGVIARAHGTFVIGDNLEEAYETTCIIERSCNLRYKLLLMK